MAEEIGEERAKQTNITHDPDTYLFGMATIKPVGGSTKGSLRFCNGTVNSDGSLWVDGCIIDTASLRSGLFEFWRAFDQQVTPILAARAKPSRKN
ncbi:MAG: hypothetical protein OEU92_04780 [Alphaproteobacteria bacterium]|nr:hypothetical protein [Alphaproteobacteria bacterium]